MDLKKAVLPWRRKSWKKRYSNTMRMQNQEKQVAGAHLGHMAQDMRGVPALIWDSYARHIVCQLPFGRAIMLIGSKIATPNIWGTNLKLHT